VVSIVLLQQGYFGPLSSRIRGLFVKHTRTGNPLVDSVAEHQATSADAYWRMLHANCYLAPIGLAVSFARRSKQQSFVALYAIVAYYFSSKMSRLMILMGPIASILTGVTVGSILNMTVRQLLHIFNEKPKKPKASKSTKKQDNKETKSNSSPAKAAGRGKGKGKAKAKKSKKDKKSSERGGILQELGLQAYIDFFGTEAGRNAQLVAGSVLLLLLVLLARVFFAYSHLLAEHMSNPSIIQVRQ